jgi:hypothetical protein
MEVKIVIPSHKRAGLISTRQIVGSSAIVCIPESQHLDYAQIQPCTEYLLHPDSVVGLTRTRQWIYEQLGDVFMLDDDITACRRLYTEPGEPTDLKPDEVFELIQQTAWNARKAGAFLFGFNNRPNPTMYNPMQPIQMSGYVTGCATGLLGGHPLGCNANDLTPHSKLWYNPAIQCNEDYWISLLNAYHNRIIWRDNRFAFIQKDTFTAKGGLAEFRNVEAEKADFELLKKCFGDAVELKVDTKLAKRKHPYQKTMRLPF